MASEGAALVEAVPLGGGSHVSWGVCATSQYFPHLSVNAKPMKNAFLLFIAIACICSCKSDDSSIDLDCSLVLCAAADNHLYIELLNPENDESLLDESIEASSLEILDGQNHEVSFGIEHYATATYAKVPVSIETFGSTSFLVNFEGGNPFTISFDTRFSEGGECCGPYTLVENVDVDNYSHDLIESGQLPLFITIYIPQP